MIMQECQKANHLSCGKGNPPVCVEKVKQSFDNYRQNDIYPDFSNKSMSMGYICGYLGLHYYQMLFGMKNVVSDLNSVDNRRLRICDVGCGPGTASLAFIQSVMLSDKWKGYDFEVTLIDPSKILLNSAKVLVNDCMEHFKINGCMEIIEGKYSLDYLFNNQFDFIAFSNVLAPLSKAKDGLSDFVAEFNKYKKTLRANPVVMFAEPHSYSNAKNLVLEIHSQFLNQGLIRCKLIQMEKTEGFPIPIFYKSLSKKNLRLRPTGVYLYIRL